MTVTIAVARYQARARLASDRLLRLLRETRPGFFGCSTCGRVSRAYLWRDHHCPHCGADGDTLGYVDGRKLHAGGKGGAA